MKYYIIFLFVLISLLFVSCNDQEQKGINLVLKVPTNNIKEIKRSANIPKDLLEYLETNAQINLGILSPGKNIKYVPITRINRELKDKSLSLVFSASLEKTNKTALIFGLGDKNYETPKESSDDEIIDAKLNQMFVNGGLYDIKNDGLFDSNTNNKIEEITLLPLLHFSANIKEIDADYAKAITENAKIKAYSSILNDKGQYYKVLETESDNEILSLSNIYGVFNEETYSPPSNLANIIITATVGNKFGFTLASKEYYDYDDTISETGSKTQKQAQVEAEYECYKYYKMPELQMCDNIEQKCFFDKAKEKEEDKSFYIEDTESFQTCTSTQSGNLLPGIKLENDIIVYSDGDTLSETALVSSVSAPKFAKSPSSNLGNTNEEDYYGNFFITGFNLDKLTFNDNNEETNIKYGRIKIYYNPPQELSSNYQRLYIEYTGPFVLYRLPTTPKESDDKPGGEEVSAFYDTSLYVLQNRLPFYKIYAEANSDKQEAEPVDLIFLENLKEQGVLPDLELKNTITNIGGKYNSFLGIQNLKKVLTSFNTEVLEITFNEERIYTNTKIIEE